MLTAFDYVWARFRARLEGLTDAEYLWEPVPGAWTLREHPDGRWRLDGNGGGGPPPDPVPVTTIAWRTCHVAALNLGAHGARAFRGTATVPADLDFPGHVAGLDAFLDGEYGRWRDGIAGLDEAGWAQELGPDWGFFATSNRLDLALHVYDELVHHAAEVGLLRDLYGRIAVISQAAES